MMTQPQFMFPGNILPPAPETNFSSPCLPADSAPQGLSNTSMNKEWLGYILALTIGIVLACNFHGVSSIVKEVSTFTFSFWIGLAGTCVSTILMGILETPVMPTNPKCILLLLGHAIGTSQISVVLPWCLQYLSPTVCGLVNSLQMVVLLILQYTVLKEVQPGHDNWVEIIGAVVCLVAVIAGPTWHLYKESKNMIEDGEENVKGNPHDVAAF